MITLEFNTKINASPEKIWEVLWTDASYRQWTSVFCEGSQAISNWNEGDSIHFVSPSGDGMNSVIDKKIDHEFMAFKHLGELKNFKPMEIDQATQEWTGSMETYELTPNGSSTNLKVRVDITEKYKEYFDTTFPKALEKVKELAEN